MTAWGALVVAVGFVAQRTIAAVLTKVGHAGAALDDSYIHFQYARAIAEGHPLRFQAGAPITSGATSLLWPVLLAPFWAAGLHGDALVWPAWALSFLALGALAWEAACLTERLAGAAAAVGAGAMTVAFGGFVWCAASGMEVVPFAWATARATRLAAEWAESPAVDRGASRAIELVILAWAAALLRPEGAVTALLVAATLGAFTRTGRWRERARALGAAAGAFAPALVLLVLTGAARSNTAVAKLLPGNPYYVGRALFDAVAANTRLLVGTLLDGEVWSAEFLPHGGAPLALAGLGALLVLGRRRMLRWRAAAVLLLALTMFAPCFYATFLWNRLRYLWPFATGWIVGLACLTRVVGDLAARLHPRGRVLTPVACGVLAGLLLSKMGGVIDDVAQSASGIDRQQVALGLWARRALPAGARIGLNDTGAIAYFGQHRTFDVVGLTTAGEARYWVAGVGSRLEHYERLLATAPSELPTHFIVYPEWMDMPMVLGAPLHEATVTDATILGGKTMRAYEADWSELGSGEVPWTSDDHRGALLDALDVADLESEAAHGYELLGAREGEEQAREGLTPDGAVIVDGGRTHRVREHFSARLRAGSLARGIIRLAGPAGTRVRVLAGGKTIATFDTGDGKRWVERRFDVPAQAALERTAIDLITDGGRVTTYHYWFFSVR